MTKKLNTDYALITGATSGIGYELCHLFASDDYNLVLVARSEERLQQVAEEIGVQYGVQVYILAKDLFKSTAAKEIYDELKQKGITVTALVNDAGQGEYGYFANTDLDRELDIIQLNVISVVALTKYFLKDMIIKNEGRILNVASLVSDYPSPLLAVYAGTKAFVLSFSQALSNELKDTNITVTALQPGVTDTDFFFKAGEQNTVGYQEAELAEPYDVARDGYKAMKKGKKKIVSGGKSKMKTFVSKLMPDMKLAASMPRNNEPADMIKKTESNHDASKKEREMIEAAPDTYKGRDLASVGAEHRSIGGKP
jgi:short-subunit dehydrogenase